MSAIVSFRLSRNYLTFSTFRTFSNYASPDKSEDVAVQTGEEQFRVLELSKSRDRNDRNRNRKIPAWKSRTPPPRSHKMPVDQDWPSVWPVARSFHPASVPLPLHQGFVKPGKTPPGKFANAELMKIPNFLHLTPPAIKRHCEALKKFCTAWPENLDTEEKIVQHFPIEISTTDYCHSGPTIRDPRARIVTMKVKLDKLQLDEHAKDKLLRLVKERYDPSTDILTIVADRCPLRKQNMEYANYLLTVLVTESKKREPWEDEKGEQDMEKYIWQGSVSQKTLQSIVERTPGMKLEPEVVQQYAQSIERFHNEGEDIDKLKDYKQSVKRLLGLKN